MLALVLEFCDGVLFFSSGSSLAPTAVVEVFLCLRLVTNFLRGRSWATICGLCPIPGIGKIEVKSGWAGAGAGTEDGTKAGVDAGIGAVAS